MNKDIKHYDFIASVYAYPEDGFSGQLLRVQEFMDDHCPPAGQTLRPFTDFMLSLNLDQQQEFFVRSFDVQAITTLDLGYVLFGDDYKRGELLVNLNREHREVENDCGIELSDHLSNVLRLLPKMQDQVIMEELARRIVWAALHKIVQAFSPGQMEMKDKFYKKRHTTILERPENEYLLYENALQALYLLMQSDFGFEELASDSIESDFLKNLHTEETLEG